MARRCGHCKQLKPDWTAVSVEVKEIFDEKEGDDHVVFAAIDCTAAGADLCANPSPPAPLCQRGCCCCCCCCCCWLCSCTTKCCSSSSII